MYCHTPAMLRSHIDDTRKMASGSGSQNQNVLLCTQSLPILLSLVKDRTHDNHCFQQEHAIPVLENVCQIQQCSHKQNYANDNAYEYSDAQKSFWLTFHAASCCFSSCHWAAAKVRWAHLVMVTVCFNWLIRPSSSRCNAGKTGTQGQHFAWAPWWWLNFVHVHAYVHAYNMHNANIVLTRCLHDEKLLLAWTCDLTHAADVHTLHACAHAACMCTRCSTCQDTCQSN